MSRYSNSNRYKLARLLDALHGTDYSKPANTAAGVIGKGCSKVEEGA